MPDAVEPLLPLTLFLPLLAMVPGGRWALPLVAPLTLWPAFRERVRTRDYLGAWALGGLGIGIAYPQLMQKILTLGLNYSSSDQMPLG